MSLVAMALMSSATFANSGENASGKEAVAGKSYVKVKEIREIKANNLKRSYCRYTVYVYNTSGQHINTHVFTATVDPENPYLFSNCNEFIADTNAWLGSNGYSLQP